MWQQFYSVDADTTGAGAGRCEIERVALLLAPLPQQPSVVARYEVTRVPLVASHATVVVTVDSSSSRKCFRCTCSKFNQRVLCTHVFTVARSIAPVQRSQRENFQQQAQSLIDVIGGTRWLGENASAPALVASGAAPSSSAGGAFKRRRDDEDPPRPQE